MTGFPDPAARSPDEAALLAAVLADLPNDLPKLVYADWLDDHGDERGEYLRRVVHAARTGGEPPDGGRFPVGWRELTGANLIRGLIELGYTDGLGAFLAAAEPAVLMDTASFGPTPAPLGSSRFGGQPDLPPDIDWPTTGGRPLGFLGQFDPADFAASPAARGLPRDWRLAVFYDTREQPWDGGDGFRLLAFRPTEPLVQHPWPAGLDDNQRSPGRRLVCHETLTMPGYDSPHLDRLPRWADDDGAYFDLIADRARGHQLLGHPRPIQNDMLGGTDRRLLAELNTDDRMGWCWGDGGALYLTMPAADLAVGRLDRVTVQLQCY